MQHMVHTGKLPGALHGDHVLGVCHHTDQAVVAALVVADGAKIPVRQILAAGAQMHRFFRVNDGVGKLPGILLRHTQQMKGQPLCRLAADARQLGKLLRQPFQSGGKIPHQNRPPRFSPPVSFAMLWEASASALRMASLTAATTIS